MTERGWEVWGGAPPSGGCPGKGHVWELRGELWEETNNAVTPWLRASHRRKSCRKASELGTTLAGIKGQTIRSERLRPKEEETGARRAGWVFHGKEFGSLTHSLRGHWKFLITGLL